MPFPRQGVLVKEADLVAIAPSPSSPEMPEECLQVLLLSPGDADSHNGCDSECAPGVCISEARW